MFYKKNIYDGFVLYNMLYTYTYIYIICFLFKFTVCINFAHLMSCDIIVLILRQLSTTEILCDLENNSVNLELVDLCVKPEYPGETRRGDNPSCT